MGFQAPGQDGTMSAMEEPDLSGGSVLVSPVPSAASGSMVGSLAHSATDSGTPSDTPSGARLSGSQSLAESVAGQEETKSDHEQDNSAASHVSVPEEAAEASATQDTVIEPVAEWCLDPLNPSLGQELLVEAKQYIAAYQQDLTNGLLTPDAVKEILSSTGLSKDILATVWDLADEEFALALFLCRRAVNGTALPSKLPAAVIP